MKLGKPQLWLQSSGILWVLFFAASMLAQVGDADKGKPPFPELRIGHHVRGEDAVAAMGDRLPEIAAYYGKTTNELAKLLRNDRTLWVNPNGRLIYICELDAPLEEDPVMEPEAARPAINSYPLDQTFRLHSLPGSKKILYLDFDGALVSGTAWNASFNGGADIIAAPFSLDSYPGTFSTTELQMIQNIWKRVAEDYSPFDIDVTTEEPSPDLLNRSSSSDTAYGNTVIITPTNFYPNAGGVSYVGSFNDVGDYYKISWAFSNMLANGEKYIAEACSHESGHSVGLHHEGTTDGVVYYQGQGEWAPIMGNSYYKNVTQWAKGEYAKANNTEDQLLVMQSYGLAYYPDDHGDTADSATMLTGVTSVSDTGFIERSADVDVFKLLTGSGALAINVSPAPLGPDLKILAELRDSNWNILGSSSLASLAASISADVAAGTYYLAVSGIGSGDPLTTGYSDYASLGQYVVTGTVADPGSLNPPVAAISAAPTTGSVPLTVAFSGLDSTDDGGIVSYSWDFGDGSPVSAEPSQAHTYTSAGFFKATLTVADNDGLTGASSVTISVSRQIYVDSVELSSDSSYTAVSANALVTVKDIAGNPIAGATVSGSWSGVVQGTATGVTGSSGTASISSPQSPISGSFTFTVTGISSPGCSYDPGLNRETTGSITASLIPASPPSVSIAFPSESAEISGTVSIQVSASSNLGISSVTVSIDGISLGTDATSPYAFSWNTLSYANGSHSITAVARDTAGNTSGASINVNVDNATDTVPPTIAITSPMAGATVIGTTSVLVSSGDNVGLTKVELYVDGNLTATSRKAPFTTKFNATKLKKGSHTLQCKAYDAAGNSSISAGISVNR
ncbi:MAG: PKD domain-containing protein [Acidobacteria bacterium]|nr:PKD domain-containing protein [Acidobacteriota bacterium]